jgi:hypothetical protein
VYVLLKLKTLFFKCLCKFPHDGNQLIINNILFDVSFSIGDYIGAQNPYKFSFSLFSLLDLYNFSLGKVFLMASKRFYLGTCFTRHCDSGVRRKSANCNR